jgi:branched-chain amino acid transport system permease protein
MIIFVELFLNGVMSGTVYGLVAIGFALIYKSSGVLNLAQGEMVMIGAYLCWAFMSQLHLPFWMSILILIVLTGALGFGLERFPLRPLTGQPILSLIMVTLAISMFLKSVAVALWGSLPNLAMPEFIPKRPLMIMKINLSQELLWMFIISIGLTGILALFFRYTKTGLNMKAVSDGHEIVQSLGINVFFIIGAVWGISAIVSALGGVLMGSMKSIGLGLSTIGLKALPAALIGGLDSIPGALIGGIIVGVIEIMVGHYIGFGLKDVAPFFLLLVVIFIKPYGLFGLKRIERI